jgi:hypothetical protein
VTYTNAKLAAIRRTAAGMTPISMAPWPWVSGFAARFVGFIVAK